MNRIRFFAATLLASSMIVACDGNAEYNDGDKAATVDADSNVAAEPSATPSTDTSAAARPMVYSGRGKVVKVDVDNSRVTLDHEKIGDWMDAMTMPFPVADATLLSGVEVGKTYTFDVAVNGDEYVITKLEVAP